MEFSFVVVAKNEEQNIADCIESLICLSCDKEVFLIDNGSSDKTVDIAKKFDINVFVDEIASVSKMRNIGASLSNNEIICFVDADVIISQDWLDKMVCHLKEEDVGCACAPERWCGDRPTWIEKTWLNAKGLADISVREVEWCQSGAFAIKRSVFNEVGGFNEGMIAGEDADLGYRVSRRYKIIKDGSVFFLHKRTPKTLKQFFWQQVWHGKSSLLGVYNHGLNRREIPSVFLPVLFGLCLFFSAFFAFFDVEISIFFIFLSFLSVAGCSAKKAFSSGMYKYLHLLLLLYFVFLSARGVSFFCAGKRISSS